ncbi:MAG TPA: aminotransferase class I/II-fold pyridoxal phosphate-dependent enzyme [Aigarchaeota archaeon]|nr:aminotransferase class I/II-fold pyridoxal phosphate-dependent enzyme [Aigarchaeota archaeon]
MAIAENLSKVDVTGIRRLFEIAEKKRDAINLGIGEPDFDTPESIKEAAYKAMKMGRTKYGPTTGLLELRRVIAEKYNRAWNANIDEDEVFITVGGENALFIAMAASLRQGDEALIISPSFPSYSAIATILGASVRYFRTRMENGFKPDLELLHESISSKTRLIIVNSPCNPTGAVYDTNIMERIVEIAAENGCYVLSDEVYDSFTYSSSFVSLARFFKRYDRIVVANSFSKLYSMTGWRLGFLITGNTELRGSIPKLQLYVNTCPATFTQYAALEALNSPEVAKAVERFREAYRRRRDLVYRLLLEAGVEVNLPEGAFYIFPKVPLNMKSNDFCSSLLDVKNVVTVPGSGFGEGGEGHFRISYAASEEKLAEACRRIAEFIQEKL